MLVPPTGVSREERISTGYRAALFLVALEDLCGHDNLRSAFHDVIAARANTDAGYEDPEAAALRMRRGATWGKRFEHG